MDRAIREAQAGQTLGEVRRDRPALDPAEQRQVVDAFLELMEGLYVHLPLKQAMYGVDPAQRLRLLRQRIGLIDELSFHYELAGIITGLRDAHTRYIGPAHLAGRTAHLPFLVEAYGTSENPHYIVSKVATDPTLIGDPHFVAGVELVWWNAVPIDRAVDLYADEETGGRFDSRRARALETLTLRSLQFGRPPDEHWVVIGYRDLDGAEREVRIDWRVVKPQRARTAPAAAPEPARALAMAIDPAAEAHRRTKKLLFAPDHWRADHQSAAAAAPDEGEWIDTPFQDAVAARKVKTPSGRFGYLRLWSFDVADDRAYVEEVVRLLGLLDDGSTRGLIIDLRANPGGLIWAAERLLQLLTPHPVEPTRFSLRATELTRAMADQGQNERLLAPWSDSLRQAVSTGDPYSLAAPLTGSEQCNDVGQAYGGPVVAVVDPNTYSSGDLFAAGFVDNRLGTLVSVGQASGGDGANLWTPDDVADALAGTDFAPPPLPDGVGYTIAARRATRIDGAAIEDLGIPGHQTYDMKREDLVEDNRGLLAFCGGLLKGRSYTRLRAEPDDDGLTVTSEGLDRYELRVDGESRASQPLADGTTTVELPPGWSTVELLAYSGPELRQRRLLTA